jgi:hypothetical protein
LPTLVDNFTVHAFRIADLLLALSCLLNGCTAMRVVRASVPSKDAFQACTGVPRILCEPCSEVLAQRVAPLLPPAINSVERSHYVLLPRGAVSYGLVPHLYYREAALFAAYLRDRNAEAFSLLLREAQAGMTSAAAVTRAYAEPLPMLCKVFLGSLGP